LKFYSQNKTSGSSSVKVKDLLLPFIDDVILSVDIAENQVTVEIPEGLDD
jgi:ribosomal 30S subunit maturation factor RimM